VLQSYDPGSRSVQWSRELPGEAVENSMLQRAQVLRNWGVTDAGDTLLAVTGQSRQWTELHALDPATGEDRWSLRRERTLAVRGVVDGTLYVLAREFERRTTADHFGTDTPTPEPRSATLYAVDRTDGSVRWRREFTGVGAVAADDSGVYVAERSLLLGFDHDGNRQWAVQANASAHDVSPGPEGIYYVTNPEWDRTVVRGVGRDGTVRWTRRFAADESVRHGDRLYVAGDRLAAVRPDGTLAWQSPGNAGRVTFAPAGDRAYVRAGWQADAVDAVALDDGTRQWTFDPPIANAWPESATDESVVAGGIGEFPDGVGQPLYRVDAASGEATARYLDQDPITTRPLGEHVFAGTGNYETGGQVLALPL
jgi:outer membrane protein assembly factor BamB